METTFYIFVFADQSLSEFSRTHSSIAEHTLLEYVCITFFPGTHFRDLHSQMIQSRKLQVTTL